MRTLSLIAILTLGCATSGHEQRENLRRVLAERDKKVAAIQSQARQDADAARDASTRQWQLIAGQAVAVLGLVAKLVHDWKKRREA